MTRVLQLLVMGFLCVALSSSTKGISHGGPHHDGYGHGSNDYHKPIKYSFSYGIQDAHYGPKFGHYESRDGYGTKGEYYVHLPDGRVQNVKYSADKHGYHPIVSYKGKAHFPTYGKSHQKGYEPHH